MKNQTFINEFDVIEIVVVGDQTIDSVRAMGEEVLVFTQKQHKLNKRALVMDNLLQMGEVPTEARKLVVELYKSVDFDKMALLGKGASFRLAANLIFRATGRGEQIKYFEDYDEAIKWLALDK